MRAAGFIVIVAIHSTGRMAAVAHARAIAVYTTSRLKRIERAPRDLVEGIGEGEEEDPDHHGGRAGGTEVPEVEHRLVDEQAGGLGGGPRPAPREEEDRVEDL